ncbi:MAG: VOC family protein [Alphaproteobacteria bacterium]|nr:MAG: VOC family protein [Alphaproteobacteria bacterium]
MTSAVIHADIDHVGIAGRNMDELLRAYRRLGFKTTRPEPLMGVDAAGGAVPLGQVSAHFMFEDSYVELSAVTGEKPDNHLEPYLARYEGLHILALAARDASKAHDRLAAAGLTPGPVQGATRDIRYGKSGRARFSWFGFAPGAFPEAFVCVVEQCTPEVVFQGELTGHPNGAVDLLGVYMVARDHAAAMARYRPFEDSSAHRFIDVMDTQEAVRRFPDMAVPAGGDCLIGMKISVRDLGVLKRCLAEASVPYVEQAGEILVSSSEAGGSIIIFSE